MVSEGFFNLHYPEFVDPDHAGCQKSDAISSTKAEYINMSGCCAQILWMRSQLTNYGLGFNKILMYRDNKKDIALSCNNVKLQVKHIDIRLTLSRSNVEEWGD
ncbi:hypothetical protein Tco_0884075 [Tanacetum coccineum]